MKLCLIFSVSDEKSNILVSKELYELMIECYMWIIYDNIKRNICFILFDLDKM